MVRLWHDAKFLSLVDVANVPADDVEEAMASFFLIKLLLPILTSGLGIRDMLAYIGKALSGYIILAVSM
jgi:hypothetical protein